MEADPRVLGLLGTVCFQGKGQDAPPSVAAEVALVGLCGQPGGASPFAGRLQGE